jgi:hypothetical protein
MVFSPLGPNPQISQRKSLEVWHVENWPVVRSCSWCCVCTAKHQQLINFNMLFVKLICA